MMRGFHRILSATLLALGVVAFVWGGSRHPTTGASLGVLGSTEYFRSFAEHVAGVEDWRVIHAAILAGPILWALGGIGLARELGRAGAAEFAATGAGALMMGAVAWAVVFVLDGFVAPIQAVAVRAGSAEALQAFATNQEVVIRLGLVSWLLVGAGVLFLGTGTLAERAGRSGVRVALGVTGIVVGAWPLVAWLAGPFRPGPFTSALWVPTAIVTAGWFLAAALVLARRPPSSQRASDA